MTMHEELAALHDEWGTDQDVDQYAYWEWLGDILARHPAPTVSDPCIRVLRSVAECYTPEGFAVWCDAWLAADDEKRSRMEQAVSNAESGNDATQLQVQAPVGDSPVARENEDPPLPGCTGDYNCPAPAHQHGCMTDTLGHCNEPEEHREYVSDGEREARAITHEWMRHLGYTDEQIASAEEPLVHGEDCELDPNAGWQCEREDGTRVHATSEELGDVAEMVMFTLEFGVHRPIDIEPSETVCAHCDRIPGDAEAYRTDGEWPCAVMIAAGYRKAPVVSVEDVARVLHAQFVKTMRDPASAPTFERLAPFAREQFMTDATAVLALFNPKEES